MPISQSTKDHMIPESLGFPLKNSNICKKCNNFIGSGVESELLYFAPLTGKLSELGIKSKSDRIMSFVKTRKEQR